MNTTKDKIVIKRAKNQLERMIYEHKLFIVDVIIKKRLNALVIFLNNEQLLYLKISDYNCLVNASQKQLENWQLIGDGIGIHWKELDADLSLKGFMSAVKSKTDYVIAA